MKVSNPNTKNIAGALIGDIVGSVYEFDNYRAKDFDLFGDYHGRKCFATDDSIMTLAVCKALMESKQDASDLYAKTVECLRSVGQPYPACGYGGRFHTWMYSKHPQPYNSYGNGAAMRVSPVAYFADSVAKAEYLAKEVTRVTHTHPEGIKGAQVTAGLVYLALNGEDRHTMRDYAEDYYDLSFTLDEIRPTYRFNETCMETVPQAIVAFLESESFEDAIRNAISVGGDSDTLAAITGGIAGAFYSVPEELYEKATTFLDDRLNAILRAIVESHEA